MDIGGLCASGEVAGCRMLGSDFATWIIGIYVFVIIQLPPGAIQKIQVPFKNKHFEHFSVERERFQLGRKGQSGFVKT